MAAMRRGGKRYDCGQFRMIAIELKFQSPLLLLAAHKVCG